MGKHKAKTFFLLRLLFEDANRVFLQDESRNFLDIKSGLNRFEPDTYIEPDQELVGSVQKLSYESSIESFSLARLNYAKA